MNSKSHKILSFKQIKTVAIALLITLSQSLLAPVAASAATVDQTDTAVSQQIDDFLSRQGAQSYLSMPAGSQKASKIKVIRVSANHTITAYTSEVGQTDDSPCITANGFNLCQHGLEDTIAINSLPFGTQVRIPDLFGDRIFTVRDRMNRRYATRVDIWMAHKQDARNFGVKTADLEIVAIDLD